MDLARKEQEIFLQALEIESPGERVTFVEEACGSDAVLLQGVRGLLGRQSRVGDFLESPAVAAGHPQSKG